MKRNFDNDFVVGIIYNRLANQSGCKSCDVLLTINQYLLTH